MILITDEEMKAIVGKLLLGFEPCDGDFVEEGAKAQLKKAVEWLKGNNRSPAPSQYLKLSTKNWQALLKEIE